jgi:hypothetical protein
LLWCQIRQLALQKARRLCLCQERRCPARPNNKHKTSSRLTDLQNAERLILLLHECVACPDAPQVLFRCLLMHEVSFSLFCNLQPHSLPNNIYIYMYIMYSPPPSHRLLLTASFSPPPSAAHDACRLRHRGKREVGEPVFSTPFHLYHVTFCDNHQAGQSGGDVQVIHRQPSTGSLS